VSEPQVDIRPQPTDAERRAIEQALAALGLLEPDRPPAASLQPPPARP
jgi:hypothetical protein